MDAYPDIRTPIGSNHDYWTFLTNHGAVLLYVAEHADDTIVEIAEFLGLRERAVAGIVADLRRHGYISVERRGRHNHYSLHGDLPLRRPAHSHLTVDALLSGLWESQTEGGSQAARNESQRLQSLFRA